MILHEHIFLNSLMAMDCEAKMVFSQTHTMILLPKNTYLGELTQIPHRLKISQYDFVSCHYHRNIYEEKITLAVTNCWKGVKGRVFSASFVTRYC